MAEKFNPESIRINEIVERRVANKLMKQKRCYYCREKGHLIKDCKFKELEETNLLLNRVLHIGTQEQNDAQQTREEKYSNEYIVKGTANGSWNEIWYVSTIHNNHISGNINVFKRIHKSFGVETKLDEDNFIFIQGIGVADLYDQDNIQIRVNSVTYSPDFNRNILSLKQLTMQGFHVKLEGQTATVSYMFKYIDPTNSWDTDRDYETRQGIIERMDILGNQQAFEAYKNEYLNKYFANLDENSNESDWVAYVIESMEFKTFESCVRFLELLEDEEYVQKYKPILHEKFEDLVKWFLHVYLNIEDERPIPPPIDDGGKLSLLNLYLIVKREGGHRVVTNNNNWASVANELGLGWDDGLFARVTYLMYLDVLVYYYFVYNTRSRAETSNANNENDINEEHHARSEEGLDITETNEENTGQERYDRQFAMFMDDSWIATKLKRKKRRIDFKKAKMALDEANESIIKRVNKVN